MNKQRRKILKQVPILLTQIADILADVKEQEEEAYGNLPESIQNGERGGQMGDYIDNLESMLDSIEDMKNMLDDIISG